MALMREPYSPAVLAQLDRLGVDHAIAVIVEHGQVVGYTMCHPAGPKQARLRCTCDRRAALIDAITSDANERYAIALDALADL